MKTRRKLKMWLGILVFLLAVVGVARADWVEQTKLTASDAAANDCFGRSISISGTTAIVGAYGNDDAGSQSGSAYLFDFSDPCNITEIKLTASDAAAGNQFGTSVALSGNTAVVGAFVDDDAGSYSGSAYLYDFSDPCNIIEIKLIASDAAAGDRFGYSVALSGTTALVGAHFNDDAGSQSGSAYLFDFSDPCNIIETKLTASDGAAGEAFGISVAIIGSTALVGALDDDAGYWSGSAYLYDFSDPCNITEIKLTASDAAAWDVFGISVAISGTTAIVGALDDDAGTQSGSAYLFDFSDPCNITEIKLTASDAAAGDRFGTSVAISGSTALVGAHQDDDAGTDSGSAYLFDFSDPCNITEIKLTASDAAAQDWFGDAVAISGSTALVGALDDDAGTDSGSAYIFALEPEDPVELLLDLTQDVIDLNLQQGITNSLNAKLDAALRALEDVNENNDVAAINTLEAFINAVEAQRSKKIPEGDADALIAAAQKIIDLLSVE